MSEIIDAEEANKALDLVVRLKKRPRAGLDETSKAKQLAAIREAIAKYEEAFKDFIEGDGKNE